jgi:hypothetical protein
MWLYVLEIPAGNQRAILAQRNLKIHRLGGQQISVEVGVLRHPPIPSRKLSSLIMSNFDAYGHKLKTFQHWPHSLLNVRGQWKKFLMGVFEVPCQISR